MSEKNSTESMEHGGSKEEHGKPGDGLHSFKSKADPIAYGMAGAAGCKSDQGKIKSQMKEYHWGS